MFITMKRIEAGAGYLIFPPFVTCTDCRSVITLHYHSADGWDYDSKNIITVCTQEQNNSGVQNLTSEEDSALHKPENMLLLKQKERITK